MRIDGRFLLTKNGKNFLGPGKIELLHMIEKTGSMNAAAKEMKMSYKAAWERMNSMNLLADEPILERQTGGKGGGGTTLTSYGKELIKTYERLDELHRQFINRFSEAGDKPELLANILNRTFLTTSARNQIPSVIADIELHNLRGVVSILLSGKTKIISTITSKSVTNMNLQTGSDIYAIIKSSDIKISSKPLQESANINVLEGVLESVETRDENTEVSLRIDEKTFLVALLQNEDKSLHVGEKAYASIPYNNIIVGL